MSKKGTKESKQSSNLNKFITKSSKAEEKSSAPATHKNEGKKKICPSLNDFLNNKEKPPLQAQPKKKVCLQHLLKQIQMQQLLEKCPKLPQLLEFICSKTALSQAIVTNLILKYITSSQHCLWSRRYAPQQISELFNAEAGSKIKKWITAFFECRNKIVEEDSFLNDQSSEKECELYKDVRQNQWQLLALIVRGRPGIGKTAAIRAVAREMDVDLQQCGNQYNQTKYLREKNESTQSQSVKTAYVKKVKIEKNAQMITKFMTPVETEKPKQSKKSQMIHNVSMVYPQTEAAKFYQELSRCVGQSKIPFILTNSGEKLPKECDKYDIIEFGSGSAQTIVRIFWAIYHLEELFPLNKKIEVEKEELFDVINAQVESIQLCELCSLSNIKDVCRLYNYRLDYIFTFLEHHKKSLNQIDVFPLLIDKLKHMNEDQLLEEIMFIDFGRLKVTNETSTSLDKTEDHNVTQQSSDSEKGKEEGSRSISRYSKIMKLAALQDTLQTVNDYGHFLHQRFHAEEWKEDPYTCIDVKTHRGIKDSLVKIANSEINCSWEKIRSSLKVSELSYLPMLVRQKRANRSSRIGVDALQKVFDSNELCYLQNFGHFIRLEK